MTRRKANGLVKNEVLVLLLALTMFRNGIKTFHGYAISKEIERTAGSRPMAYTTVYRCLDRLEEAGLVSGDWEMSDRGGPPRRMYTLTPDGLAQATQQTDDKAAVDFNLGLA